MPKTRRSRKRTSVTIAEADFPRSTATLRRWAREVIEGENIPGTIGIRVITPAQMRVWNRRVFGKRTVTDVISLSYAGVDPVPDPTGLAGEVLTSFGVARHRAGQYGATPVVEFRRYLIHGLLHLAGFDHVNCSARKALLMRTREEYYLKPRRER